MNMGSFQRKNRFSRFFLLGAAAFLLASCGDKPEASSVKSSVTVADISAEVAGENDFTLDYYADKGGFMLGDYRGTTTDFVVPDTATQDGITAPIVGIAERAFYGRSGIRSVILGDNVRYLGSYCFAHSGIKNLQVTPSLIEMGDHVFADCEIAGFTDNNYDYLPSKTNPCCVLVKKLTTSTKAQINVRTESIINGVLTGDAMEIRFRPNLVSIGDCNVNWDYTDVADKTTFTFRNLGENAFRNHPKAQRVTLTEGAVSLGANALSDNYYLTQAVLPDSVTSIGSGAFYYCSSLTSISLPKKIKSVGSGAFTNCYDLKNTYFNGDKAAWDALSGKDNLVGQIHMAGEDDKSTIEIRYGTTKIEDAAYRNNKDVTRVIIPDTVTEIGSSAFEGCTSLTSLEIPSSVTSIGAKAFAGCTSLTSMTTPFVGPNGSAGSFSNMFGTQDLPEGITSITINGGSIPESAFYNNKTIQEIEITKDVSGEIGKYTFYKCLALKSLKIDKDAQITAIGDYACEDCIALTTVSFPRSVKSIGKEAFKGCSLLESPSFPFYLETIGDSAFDGCVKITGELDLSSTKLTRVGYSAFQGCSGITKATLPGTAKSVSRGAFFNCKALTELTIPFLSSFNVLTSNSGNGVTNNYLKKITFLDGASELSSLYGLANFTALEEISIPASVTRLGAEGFYYCIALKKVTFASGSQLNSIGEKCFASCRALTEISLPSTLKTIESYAFYRCTALAEVSLPSGLTTIKMEAFGGCNALTSVVIPSSVKSMGTYAFECPSSLTIYCEHPSDPGWSSWSGKAKVVWNYQG